jgi:uncharacterized protein YjbI with pentapeptide repeats
VTNPEVIAIVVVAIAALVLLGWLWWQVPKWQLNSLKPKISTDNPKERADVEDNFRKTFGQVLAGAAVLIGAGSALFQFLQQQKAAQEQQQISQSQFLKQQEEFVQQQQAARDLLISNQVSKGFEQLAGREIVMRLGGIYALEGVMNTSEQYHQPVLEALCAFVRENTIGKTVPDKPTTDVQAALTVIGRRAAGPGRVDLANISIPGTNLVGAKLDHANLTLAKLDHANLTGANLSGAGLRRANLSGADLTGADLSRANLTGANLSDAYLDGTNLTGAYLDGTNLTGADLHDANLSDANLRGANLIRANLPGTNLSGANLSGAKLGNVDLTYVENLTQGQLDKACGDENTRLPEGLTPKPCPPSGSPQVP